jgi:hypothetical protein
VNKAGDSIYNPVGITVVIQVQKAKPVITTAPTASCIPSGSLLSDSTLTGGATHGVTGEMLKGTFTWSNSEQSFATAGDYELTFTPRDGSRYTTVTMLVPVSNPYVLAPYIANESNQVSIDLTKGSSLLAPAQMNQLVALNKEKAIVLQGNGYEINFPCGSLSAVVENKDVDLNITFDTGDEYDAIRSLTGDNFLIMLNFSYSGQLPGEAMIRIYVGNQYAGQTLAYQFYNSESGKLQLIQNTIVDAEGYALVKQSHCSSYVFTRTDKDVANNPTTGDSSLIWWLLSSMCAAVLAFFIILVQKRRQRCQTN